MPKVKHVMQSQHVFTGQAHLSGNYRINYE